ncbi:MAG: hypothetical protein AB7V46_08475, partial [Thermomicrobiales bacterium]
RYYVSSALTDERDFQRQYRRKPARYQRIKVSDFITTRSLRLRQRLFPQVAGERAGGLQELQNLLALVVVAHSFLSQDFATTI